MDETSQWQSRFIGRPSGTTSLALPETKEMVMEAKDIIDGQLEAYRKRDLEGFLGFYSPEIAIKSGDGKTLMGGLNAMRRNYGKSFAENPIVKVVIANRIVFGEFVIDEEYLTGFTRPGSPIGARAVLIYRVRDELISDVILLS
jgi:hypothetical protein